jgi:glycosyltransferase involved in cell wall biosynthesis
MVAGYNADASWICRQLLPMYFSVEALVKKPMILDVDDAIWLTRGGHRVAALARSARTVVCGNVFLAERFRDWNSNVVVIPTAIDTDLYQPGNAAGDGVDGVVIGWTGTSVNLHSLYAIEEALNIVFDHYTEVKLIVVSDKAPKFRSLAEARVEFVRWTPAANQDAMARMSIGLMPLDDSEWARGKCSYKMLAYMAAYLPVVVSPVGMNNEVLAHGEIGYGVSMTAEWVAALSTLIENQVLRLRMGRAGRKIVEAEYSVSKLVERYCSVFDKIE